MVSPDGFHNFLELQEFQEVDIGGIHGFYVSVILVPICTLTLVPVCTLTPKAPKHLSYFPSTVRLNVINSVIAVVNDCW